MRDYARELNYAFAAHSSKTIPREVGCLSHASAHDNLKCPLCRSNNTIPIVYGFPSHDLMESMLEAVDRGEVELGGCVLHENPPTRHCKNCGHYFGLLQQSASF